MKKETMRVKLNAHLAFFGILASSLGGSVTAHAQAYPDYGANPPTQGPVDQTDSYSVWCDQVTQELMQAQGLALNLYRRQLYTQARTSIMTALQRALASMQIPGSRFRPATYREIQRTMELVQALDATQPSVPGGSSSALKAKMIAYVALQRISFIAYVKDAVDIDYNIPCRRICHGNGYENPRFQEALATTAAEQLSRAQSYSSFVGANGVVYPINDTPYYFVIVSKAALWAAEDLSMSLFNTSFACAITQLRSLGYRAASSQAMLGDVSAVQEIHAVVNDLIYDLTSSSYGCGHR